MRKMIVYGIIASILVLVAAQCTRTAAPTEVEVEVTQIVEGAGETVVEEVIVAATPSYGAADYARLERLIVRNASLDLVVLDTQVALEEINGLVDELGGYIVESNVYQYQEGLQAHVTLRVPAESLNVALERIRDLATEVRSEHISGQDVTEEYVDINARLEILEAAEQELLQLYRTRQTSGEVADILEVYRQLVTFRQEIESLTGRIQYLEQAAALVTVTVALTPDVLAQPIETGDWRPQEVARAALEALVHSLQFLVTAVIWFFIVVLPLAALIGAPAYGLWRLIRKRRARRQPPSAE